MMRIPILMILTLAFGCANHSAVADERPEPAAGVEFERLEPQTYTPADWPTPLEAIVYRPESSSPMPGVLVVHGGGWTRRSPADMERISEALATRGFVAVNVAYRLAPEHLYPAAMHDLRRALDWMVDNVPALKIDPERIGAFGYSAGAHLVSLLAVLESGTDTAWNAPARGYRLKAVVAGGTPADLTRWPNSPLVKTFLGETLEENPDLWAEASPIYHVTAAAPPFFLYHGGLDMLVEVEQAEAMKQKLDDAGVHAELYTVAYHGHLSMFVLNRSAVRKSAAFLGQMLE